MSIFCVSLPLTQIYTKRRAKTRLSAEGGGETASGPVLYPLDYIFDRNVTPLVYPLFTNGTEKK